MRNWIRGSYWRRIIRALSSVLRTVNNLSWMIGGAQGTGVDSSASIFARACVLGGLWVFGTREYYSNIKGLHSYFEVRVRDTPVNSKVDAVDLLATFDAETVIRHAGTVRANGGGIIYNSSIINTEIEKISSIENPVVSRIKSRLSEQSLSPNVSGILEEAKRRGITLYPVPYDDIISETAEKLGGGQLSKFTRIINVLTVAASLALLGFDETYLTEAVNQTFADKKRIVPMNLTGAKLVRDYVLNQMLKSQGQGQRESSFHQLRPIENTHRLLLAGNQTVALGKIIGGCRMQTYYPITPASDESEFLESHENFDLLDGISTSKKGSVLVIQTEDELSAITMATGAALTGTRSATSTSGPGFCLMVEGTGWAGMNEVPVVITLYSRGGPATGLPTRTEQGDLEFVLHAAHGEFPRIVICSGDMEECFYDSIRALNYAEMFQLPVIHMIDKAMANSQIAIRPPDPKLLPINRGKLIAASIVAPGSHRTAGESTQKYRRFAFTDDGISPRAVLGADGYTFWNAGDEHDEFGHIEEDPDNRIRMMEKRMRKLETAEKEIPDEEKINYFPPRKQEHPQVTIVSWGSSKGAILDAREALRSQGIDPAFLQIRLASPFPTEIVKQHLEEAELVIGIEQNYSGQMASVIAQKTCFNIKNRVVKYNGRPISQDEVYDSVKQIVSNPEKNQRVVLTHGA